MHVSAFLVCVLLPVARMLCALFSVMVPSLMMLMSKTSLAERQKLDRSLLDPPSCVDFKVAKPLSKLSPIMDATDMAALVCRHELVAVAVNMFTPENFCYYDIILERMLKIAVQHACIAALCSQPLYTVKTGHCKPHVCWLLSCIEQNRPPGHERLLHSMHALLHSAHNYCTPAS